MEEDSFTKVFKNQYKQNEKTHIKDLFSKNQKNIKSAIKIIMIMKIILIKIL